MIYLLLQLHLLETGRDDLSAPERGKNLVEKPNHLNAFQMNENQGICIDQLPGDGVLLASRLWLQGCGS